MHWVFRSNPLQTASFGRDKVGGRGVGCKGVTLNASHSLPSRRPPCGRGQDRVTESQEAQPHLNTRWQNLADWTGNRWPGMSLICDNEGSLTYAGGGIPTHHPLSSVTHGTLIVHEPYSLLTDGIHSDSPPTVQLHTHHIDCPWNVQLAY